MYKYENSLQTFDENQYPLSMEYQKESRYQHQHGIADKNGFTVQLSGSKHLFCTPDIKEFSFKINTNLQGAFVESTPVQFGILFGYHASKKTGHCLEISYNTDHVATISLCQISNYDKKVLNEVQFSNIDWVKSEDILIEFFVSETECSGSIGECKFSFPCDARHGRLGIMVSAMFEKIVFTDVVLTTNEEPSKSLVRSQNININNPNGGMLPYHMKMEMYKYDNGVHVIEYVLSGGISSHKTYKNEGNCWLFQYDDITNPYIKIIDNKNQKKYYLYNNIARFMDPRFKPSIRNVYANIMSVKDTPLSGVIYLPQFFENSLWGFGYEDFYSCGTTAMTGAYEYLYNKAAKQVYCGEPLEKEIISSLLSVDKKIVKDIPNTICQYEDAVFHAENNHYFYVDETPKFTLNCHTTLNPQFLNCRIKLLNAFFEEKQLLETDILQENSNEKIGKYLRTKYSFVLPSLNCGVYHVSIDIFYGDEIIHNHCSAFEVIDPASNISPQEASGLPHFTSGDGAPGGLESSLPDFYSKKPEFDWGHYVQTAHYLPYVSQKKRIWEILRLYKRSFFTWMTSRTIQAEDVDKMQDVIENADYINYLYPEANHSFYRYDLYYHSSYNNFVLKTLNNFLNEHPDYRNQLDIKDATKEFTQADMLRLLKLCGSKWIAYCLNELEKIFDKQNKELKALNPKAKRSSYGPWPDYCTPWGSGYIIKWFGFEPKHLNRFFDGFLQFEDYPLTCAYPTARGTWGIMTTKLLCPEIKLHPELYMDYPAGCPDQAVSTAYPPFGKSSCPVYFSATQIADYAYGTPYYKNNTFNYWKDYGFSLFLWLNKPKERSRSILSFWGKLLQNKPVRPCKTTAFLYEISPKEDRYDYDKVKNHFYNISEANLSYLFITMKTSGFTGGFATTYNDILTLTANDINSIVLPDLSDASKEVLDKIRSLHADGVTLIAVGNISELEDLFGVAKHPVTCDVNYLSDGYSTENITPFTAEFFYSATNGKPELWSNNNLPVIITAHNTILLNTAVSQVGIDAIWQYFSQGRPNISALLKETIIGVLEDKVCPIVKSSADSGVAVLETENGETLMVLTDYSDYDQSKLDTTRWIDISFAEPVEDIVYLPVDNHNPKMHKLYQDNHIAGIHVQVRPQETLMFKLTEK